MIIDHIGVAVKSIEKGIKHWQNVFGYKQVTEIVINTRQKVKVAFMEKDNSLPIKLISPSDETSPLNKFLAKSEGLHHLCFKTDNLDDGLIELKGKGLRVLAPPQPGEAFDNENIAFVFGKMGLNIELIDTDKRAGRLDI
ncbi:MAG: methylmalonyl-CoA epimerase [candidate division Zixibacteria bacterium]|nr:methylmalonyl-CoA epimerase [candidate division Zixibacteria bacterium]